MVNRLALFLLVGSIGWLAVGSSAMGQTNEEKAARKHAEAATITIEKLGSKVKVEKDMKAAGQPVSRSAGQPVSRSAGDQGVPADLHMPARRLSSRTLGEFD